MPSQTSSHKIDYKVVKIVTREGNFQIGCQRIHLYQTNEELTQQRQEWLQLPPTYDTLLSSDLKFYFWSYDPTFPQISILSTSLSIEDWYTLTKKLSNLFQLSSLLYT